MQRDDGMATLRVPPNAVQSEAAVLGCLLQDNAAFDVIGDVLKPEQFYSHQNRTIYAAIAWLILSNKPADAITVFEALKQSGKDEEAGGLSYLMDLTAYRISPKNGQKYAQLVAERAILRAMIEASDKIAGLAFEQSDLSVSDRLDQAQQAIQAVQIDGGRKMPRPIQECVAELIDRIQDRSDGNAPRGIDTGIPHLSRLLGGGWKGGKQVILAARPSIGKSSLAMNFCLTAALARHPAAFLSQEMSGEELVDRAASTLGRIDLERVISGQLENDEWVRLTEAVERIRCLPLFLDDQPALTLADISAKARMLKRQHGLQLLVIDYIQLCAGGKDKDNRHHQIEQLSRGLKGLAKQLDICILTLSQLNREVEKRTNGRPQMSDLKESGAIEEDADVVMLLSRNGDERDGFRTIHCEVPKNRQGKTGFVTLGFDGRYQEWHETITQAEPMRPAKRHYTDDV